MFSSVKTMVVWVLLGVAVLLFIANRFERFEEPAGGFNQVTPPSETSSIWTSKVRANGPFDADIPSYIKALKSFYDTVYKPSQTRPSESTVDAFVLTPFPKVDPAVLKTIIMESFHIDSGMTAAAKEQKQVKFAASAALEPADGVDEVRVRTEIPVTPADTTGPFDKSPEGVYAPVEKTIPTHPNTCEGDSWHKGQFASVENV
jgi:hypothetical protein